MSTSLLCNNFCWLLVWFAIKIDDEEEEQRLTDMTTTQQRRKRTMTTKTMKDPHSSQSSSLQQFGLPELMLCSLQCRLQFSGRLWRFGLPELLMLCYALLQRPSLAVWPLPKLMLYFALALSSVWCSRVEAMLCFAATIFGGSATVCGSAFSS